MLEKYEREREKERDMVEESIFNSKCLLLWNISRFFSIQSFPWLRFLVFVQEEKEGKD